MAHLAAPCRHYFNSRSLLSGAVWILLLTIWQARSAGSILATLGDLARFGLMSFRILAFVQLTLLLSSPLFRRQHGLAGKRPPHLFAVPDYRLDQSRDRAGQAARQPAANPAAARRLNPGVRPADAAGGVDPWQIGQATLVLAVTALAAGSLGGLIAFWRDKTFQALAMTVLFLVLYLCLVQASP